MELVFAFKDGATTSLISIEKGEGSLEKIEGGSSSEDTNGKVMAPIHLPLFCLGWHKPHM